MALQTPANIEIDAPTPSMPSASSMTKNKAVMLEFANPTPCHIPLLQWAVSRAPMIRAFSGVLSAEPRSRPAHCSQDCVWW